MKGKYKVLNILNRINQINLCRKFDQFSLEPTYCERRSLKNKFSVFLPHRCYLWYSLTAIAPWYNKEKKLTSKSMLLWFSIRIKTTIPSSSHLRFSYRSLGSHSSCYFWIPWLIERSHSKHLIIKIHSCC